MVKGVGVLGETALKAFYGRVYSQPGCQDLVLRQSSAKASSQVLPLSKTSSASCGALCPTIATDLPS